VARRNASFLKLRFDFVDALHAADHRRLRYSPAHAKGKVHVERVVVGLNGRATRAAGDRLHHRRLDFQ